MNWNLDESIAYYRSAGAPGDQNALISLLREIQREYVHIPEFTVTAIAKNYGIKESLILALIRRIPSLKPGDGHILELCAGPNCPKRANLASLAENLCKGKNVQLKLVPCMRMCAKGPNLRWDGRLHQGATEALLRSLTEKL